MTIPQRIFFHIPLYTVKESVIRYLQNHGFEPYNCQTDQEIERHTMAIPFGSEFIIAADLVHKTYHGVNLTLNMEIPDECSPLIDQNTSWERLHRYFISQETS